jgi:hypothetical protein
MPNWRILGSSRSEMSSKILLALESNDVQNYLTFKHKFLYFSRVEEKKG